MLDDKTPGGLYETQSPLPARRRLDYSTVTYDNQGYVSDKLPQCNAQEVWINEVFIDMDPNYMDYYSPPEGFTNYMKQPLGSAVTVDSGVHSDSPQHYTDPTYNIPAREDNSYMLPARNNESYSNAVYSTLPRENKSQHNYSDQSGLYTPKTAKRIRNETYV